MRGIVLATRHARALPSTTHKNRFAPCNKRGSGAPRGASNQCRAARSALPPINAFRAARAADKCTQSAQLICFRGALAFRRCCGSRQGFDPLTQLQAMLPGTRVEAGVTRPLLSQSRDSTSRRGPRAAGRDAQSRPGAECIVPRAGTAPAPSFESALAKGALSGQGERNITSDNCQQYLKRRRIWLQEC
jgi:hypothetical protein